MESERDKSSEALESVVRDMKIEEPEGLVGTSCIARTVSPKDSVDNLTVKASKPLNDDANYMSASPIKVEESTMSPKQEDEDEKVIKADVIVKHEAGQPPKLSRTVSQKVPAKSASLYVHYVDKTAEATARFQVIRDCIYAAKYLGATEHALECDCAEEWGMYYYPPNNFASVTVEQGSRQIASFLTIVLLRCVDSYQQCMWTRFGLYKPCYQDGMHR